MIHHLAWLNLSKNAGNYVHFLLHFHQRLHVSFRVLHGSFSASFRAFSRISLPNSFFSNQPHYTSYEHHNLFMFMPIRIQP